MSVAAVSQLVATGSIDAELTGSPQITFWRYTHYKHTAFSMEGSLLQFEAGGSHPGNNQRTSLRLHRSGDLVHKAYAVIDLPGIANVKSVDHTAINAQLAALGIKNADDSPKEVADGTTGAAEAVWDAGVAANYSKTLEDGSVQGIAFADSTSTPYYTQGVGQYLIKEAELLIGSQPIDRVYNHYLNMWSELSTKPGKNLAEMIGKYSTTEVAAARSASFQRLYVPLEFFHTRASGSALPIVSLQFHDVQIACTWNSVRSAICNLDATGYKTVVRPGQASLNDTGDANGVLKRFGLGDNNVKTVPSKGVSDADVNVQLEVQYIYLDLQERQRFSKGAFQILISEVQTMSTPTKITDETHQMNLTFNHAVIQILFAVLQSTNEKKGDHFNYDGVVEPTTGIARNPVKEVDLRLNNQQRFYATHGNYFKNLQSYQHHTNMPSSHVMTYSFALHPESENPSGSINLSRVDNAQLTLKFDSAMWTDNTAHGGEDNSGNSVKVLCFARSWNVLRVTLGLAGKAFAN